nr:YceI family protein [Paenalcaligenes hominis]
MVKCASAPRCNVCLKGNHPNRRPGFLGIGVLTIKGHEQTIEFPATVTQEDGRAIFTGSFDMLRGDYAIGEGAWSKFDIVANEVRIEFSIVATQ